MLRRLVFLTAIWFVCVLPAPAQAQTPQILRMLLVSSPSDPPNLRALLERHAQEFMDENPGVTIETEFVDNAQMRQRLIDDLNAGSSPDIASIAARWVPEFVSLGMIEPLDRYITPEFRARFIPRILEEGAIYQGRMFGLPIATSTRALYYNLDLFEQAGISAPPRTWDDLREAALAIRRLPGDSYGFGLQGGGGIETNVYYYYFVWGNGGDLYNTTRVESALDSDAAIEALTFLSTLIADGGTQPNPTDAAYERRRGVETLFQRGAVGMVISGPWFANLMRLLSPDVRFGIAPIPYNTTPATYGVMDALSILRTSENKDLAWRFLEFLYDDQRRLEYVTSIGVLPELISVAENPAFAENPDYAVFLDMLPDARFEPLHAQSEAISQVVIETIRAVYAGEADPADALRQAAGQIDGLLALSAAGW